MKLLRIEDNWRTFFTFTGGDKNCAHEYAEHAPELDEDEYSGTLVCVHCGCHMRYCVADIGD